MAGFNEGSYSFAGCMVACVTCNIYFNIPLRIERFLVLQTIKDCMQVDSCVAAVRVEYGVSTFNSLSVCFRHIHNQPFKGF
jgi:hypothetical protein